MKVFQQILICSLLIMSACSNVESDFKIHEKLSKEATETYGSSFEELGVCSISRPSFEGENDTYSDRIAYRLCSETETQVVRAPLTKLLHSISIESNTIKIRVDEWQLEKLHYKEFQEHYFGEHKGKLSDALLVIKNDVQSRREIASSNGMPLMHLDSLSFSFTKEEREILDQKMAPPPECKPPSPCVAL